MAEKSALCDWILKPYNSSIKPMRWAMVFKWRECFRDGKMNMKGQNRLFHYPPEACGKQSAACFREVGGAL
jgi:hypothetical protein